MKRQSFAPFFVVYLLALPASLALRVWLKLECYDLATGFYNGGALPALACDIIMLATPALLFLFSLLRRPGGNYPLPHRGVRLPLLLIALGIAMFCAASEAGGGPRPLPPPRPDLAAMPPRLLYISSILQGMAALGLIAAGGYGVVNRRMRGAFTLPAAVAMLVCLIGRFNVYKTITPIADNLLSVLFMAFAAVFFVGHARTLSGFERKDGRNYVIPAGLSASLFAFLLVLPNWVRMMTEQTKTMPALHLGEAESVFAFLTGLYALAFTVSTCGRIKQV